MQVIEYMLSFNPLIPLLIWYLEHFHYTLPLLSVGLIEVTPTTTESNHIEPEYVLIPVNPIPSEKEISSDLAAAESDNEFVLGQNFQMNVLSMMEAVFFLSNVSAICCETDQAEKLEICPCCRQTFESNKLK